MNRKRHQTERLEFLQRGQVLAVRLGWRLQTDQEGQRVAQNERGCHPKEATVIRA
jgi:hypothetical protein